MKKVRLLIGVLATLLWVLPVASSPAFAQNYEIVEDYVVAEYDKDAGNWYYYGSKQYKLRMDSIWRAYLVRLRNDSIWFAGHKADRKVEMVDMGLSVLWANYNVGADALTGEGSTFAWGETEPMAADPVKTSASSNWDNYKWASGDGCSKYSMADGKRRLEPEDDAAAVNWGGKWRMPTNEEWAELLDPKNCEFAAVDSSWLASGASGFAGTVVHSKITGNRIYLPAYSYWAANLGCPYLPGPKDYEYEKKVKKQVNSWETYIAGKFSLLDFGPSAFERFAFYVAVSLWPMSAPSLYESGVRSGGKSVRAVCTSENFKPSEPERESFGREAEAVDMGLSVMWSSWNFGAGSVGELGMLYAYGDRVATDDEVADWGPYLYPTREHDADVVKEQWGDDWRLPTKAEWEELTDPRLCKWSYFGDVYGEKGYLVTSRITGNSIVIPLDGYYWWSAFWLGGGCADEVSADYAKVSFSSGMSFGRCCRYEALSLRPVTKRKADAEPSPRAMPATVETVDLGLSVCWASCNVGALSGQYDGDYFAWGETERKDCYDVESYKQPKRRDLKKNPCGEGRSLPPELDAASVNMGGYWRTPTADEWAELANRSLCSWQWTDNYNGSWTSGFIITSLRNGNELFLPATGYVRDSANVVKESSSLFYWGASSSDGEPIFQRTRSGFRTGFECDEDGRPAYVKSLGLQVRAVRPRTAGVKPVKADLAKDEAMPEPVDLGLSVCWASCNIGASDPRDGGDNLAWGEIQPKDVYTSANYKGPDVKSTLLASGRRGSLTEADDAASARWGGTWRTPTADEWAELCDPRKCKWTRKDDGFVVESLSNGNSIFLPSAIFNGEAKDYVNLPAKDYYWTSSARGSEKAVAYSLSPKKKGGNSQYDLPRYIGTMVRPVTPASPDMYPKLAAADSQQPDGSCAPGGNAEAVDMGLSVKWSSWNLGANAVAAVGSKFAWGEVNPKDEFSVANYYWTSKLDVPDDGRGWQMLKYQVDDKDFRGIWYGSWFCGDGLSTLQPADDAATAQWANGWRTPTKAEWQELILQCKWMWTENYESSGLNGYVIKSYRTGNSIFLPVPDSTLNAEYMTSELSKTRFESTLSVNSPLPISTMPNRSLSSTVKRWQGVLIRPVRK